MRPLKEYLSNPTRTLSTRLLLTKWWGTEALPYPGLVGNLDTLVL